MPSVGEGVAEALGVSVREYELVSSKKTERGSTIRSALGDR
jgi:hypothetical protein